MLRQAKNCPFLFWRTSGLGIEKIDLFLKELDSSVDFGKYGKYLEEICSNQERKLIFKEDNVCSSELK